MNATERYFRIATPGGPHGELWKAPDEAFDVTFDWSRVLNGDPIATSTWLLPDNWTQPQASSVDATETKAIAWVGGGQSGTMSVLINRITTDAGRIYQAYVITHVREVPS